MVFRFTLCAYSASLKALLYPIQLYMYLFYIRTFIQTFQIFGKTSYHNDKSLSLQNGMYTQKIAWHKENLGYGWDE